MALWSSPAMGAPTVVAIDPGHGGRDTGAVHSQVLESKVVLQISQKLHQRLRRSQEFQPKILRQSDQALPLESRVQLAKNQKAQIYLSIHANSNTDSNIRGMEFYIQSQMPPEEEMRFLANRENEDSLSSKNKASTQRDLGTLDNILYDLRKGQRILDSYKLSWHLKKSWNSKLKKRYPIRQGPFYVLYQNEIPAVLVEVGYLTNSKDRKNLQKDSFQSMIAEKIYRGLKAYIENRDKAPSQALQMQHAKNRSKGRSGSAAR